MKKQMMLAAALLGAGLAFACFGSGKAAGGYRTGEIRKGDLTRSVKATGAVQPEVLVQVGSQVTGQVKKIYVDYNSRVTEGQVLAEIDNSPFQAQVDQDRANLNRTYAQVSEAKARLELAEKLLERDRVLAEKGLITVEELETSETNVRALKASRSLTWASAAQAKASLKMSEAKLEYCTIKSPVGGVVIARNVDVGQSVAASLSIQTMFSIATDLSRMQVKASVSEADIGVVKEGLKVRFRVDAWPDLDFAGEVQQVRMNAETVSNVVTYPVIVTAQNPDGKLKPGMTATIFIETETRPQVLHAPNAALRFQPATAAPAAEKETGPAVWIETGEGLKRLPVKTGLSDGSRTEIEGPGVTEGMLVVTGTAVAGAAGSEKQVTNPFMPKFPGRKTR